MSPTKAVKDGEHRELWQGELPPPAPRLGDEAMQPLEVQLPHPQRSAGRVTAQVVEDAADTDADRDASAGKVAVQPELLFWGAVGNQQDVNAGCTKRGQDLSVILRPR